jgi:hypothetical protein
VPIDPQHPDLVASLHLDPYAPRAARHCVRRVDSPSPDLRDAVTLLTSELVTRAVAPAQPQDEELCLRVWMPADVVRVELTVPREQFFAEPRRAEDLGIKILDSVADRWSIQPVGGSVSLWFEIDRREVRPESDSGKERPEAGRREAAPEVVRGQSPEIDRREHPEIDRHPVRS